MKNKIDHFAIGADSLDQGIAALRSSLGIEVPRGGKHDVMGTHNCVVQAGSESFLEILAIDPEAGEPARPRWFTLDAPETRARLRERPRALCWVVGTDDLDAVIAASSVKLGEVVTFTRGDRSWRLTVPDDGSLPEAGLLPAFIEWSPGAHPSSAMQDLGIALDSIRLGHPDPSYLKDLLKTLGVDHLADVETADEPSLTFALSAPGGGTVLFD